MDLKKLQALLIALTLSGCASLPAPKTPQGVDVAPVHSLTLNRDVNELESIRSVLPMKSVLRNEWKSESLVFSSPYGQTSSEADGIDQVYRTFYIQRFDDQRVLIQSYRALRDEYSSDGWKLFKEEGDSTNRYFSAYKGPWKNYDHFTGIPTGEVINNPEIEVVFIKRNLLITVSHDSYAQDSNYVAKTNEDIVYVADLLKKAGLSVDARPIVGADSAKRRR